MLPKRLRLNLAGETKKTPRFSRPNRPRASSTRCRTILTFWHATPCGRSRGCVPKKYVRKTKRVGLNGAQSISTNTSLPFAEAFQRCAKIANFKICPKIFGGSWSWLRQKSGSARYARNRIQQCAESAAKSRLNCRRTFSAIRSPHTVTINTIRKTWLLWWGTFAVLLLLRNTIWDLPTGHPPKNILPLCRKNNRARLNYEEWKS